MIDDCFPHNKLHVREDELYSSRIRVSYVKSMGRKLRISTRWLYPTRLALFTKTSSSTVEKFGHVR